MADWNWFYSSVAQSCAAIVGIFGAFVFSKILSAQASFSARIEKGRSLILRASKLRDEADNLDFDWYTEEQNRYGYERVKMKLARPGDLMPAADYYQEGLFSAYSKRDDILHGITKLIEEEKQYRLAKQVGNPYDNSPFSYVMATSPNEAHAHLKIALDATEVDIKNQVRTIREYLAASNKNPESSAFVTFSALGTLVLFFVGVIWPLSSLPAASGPSRIAGARDLLLACFSDKGAVLVVVAIVFVIIVAVFVVINLKLRVPATMIVELERASNLLFYSDHLSNKYQGDD